MTSDKCSLSAVTCPTRERPVVTLCFGDFEDVFTLINLQYAIVFIAQIGVCSLLEEVGVVEGPFGYVYSAAFGIGALGAAAAGAILTYMTVSALFVLLAGCAAANGLLSVRLLGRSSSVD